MDGEESNLMFATLVIRSREAGERKRERVIKVSPVRSEGPAFYTSWKFKIKGKYFSRSSRQLFISFFFLVLKLSLSTSVSKFEWDSSGACFAIVLHEARLPVHAYIQVSNLEIVIENRSLKLQLMDDEARIESTILGPYQTKRYSSKRIHITSS